MAKPRRVGSVMLVVGVLAALAALAAQSPAPPAGSTAPPVFRAGTAVIPVDVRVLDKDGRPVTDLTLSDFTVRENGVPQVIRHFVTQALAPEPAASRSAGAGRLPDTPLDRRVSQSVPDIAPQTFRVFLIVLSRGRLDGPAKGLDGMIHFVRDRVLPQDRVGVLAWDRATDFTTDHDHVLDVLTRFKDRHNAIESEISQYYSGLGALYADRQQMPTWIQKDIDTVFGGPGAPGVRTLVPAPVTDADRIQQDERRTVDLYQSSTGDTMSQAELDLQGLTFDQYLSQSAQTGQDLGNLYAAVEYLRGIAGEKHLIWVSESGLMTQRHEDDVNFARAASDAEIVVDIIRTSGTAYVDIGMSADSRTPMPARQAGQLMLTALQPAATSRTIATLTGGRFDANKFPTASDDADHINQDSRFEYVLGYYPADTRWDGRFRNITVDVDRPGLTVLYRHGYFASVDPTPLDARGALTYGRVTLAAGYAKDIPDLKMTGVTVKPGASPSSVDVALTLDVSRVGFTAANGQHSASIDLVVVCTDTAHHTVTNTWKTIALRFADDRFAAALAHGVQVAVTAAAPESQGSTTSIKVIAYDYTSDLIGSTTVKIDR